MVCSKNLATNMESTTRGAEELTVYLIEATVIPDIKYY
jgi:hypothetical protein